MQDGHCHPENAGSALSAGAAVSPQLQWLLHTCKSDLPEEIFLLFINKHWHFFFLLFAGDSLGRLQSNGEEGFHGRRADCPRRAGPLLDGDELVQAF